MLHLRVFWNFGEPVLKFEMRHLMVSKIKNLVFILEWDIKICPSESWFVITLQSKKDRKDQEPIQSRTTPVTGYQIGK